MSHLFWIPLLLSFLFNISSAFTTAYSRRLGQRGGQLLSTVLRNGLGIPLLAVAFLLAARHTAPRLLASNVGMDAAGGSLLSAGALLILWSLLALRLPAAAPSVGDSLVRHGPYARVRHPLYDGVLCELGGAVLLRPTWPILVSGALTAVWVLVQARAEEQDLLQRIAGYRAYMDEVPRFVPRIRKGDKGPGG